MKWVEKSLRNINPLLGLFPVLRGLIGLEMFIGYLY